MGEKKFRSFFKLAPCPKCESRDLLFKEISNNWFVVCSVCGTTGKTNNVKEKASELWNSGETND